ISLLDCTRTRKGNMQLRLPASGARVGEKVISLLDCTRTRKGNMQLRLPASGARVVEKEAADGAR
ncbi:MAG: hypothetical protein K1W30_13045, partial [Lachnospiraceae bacterium]